ncbi:MAG: hypothetical protein IKN56_06120 [Clostridia bacterium]|nr:hypothetical protein [Clostridia bacterium]MBR4451020.1 hypothetical protein [Clostridia bacterium]
MKKTLSLRDVNMILVVVGIIILLATYFLVFRSFSEKNSQLDTQNTERTAHLKELQGYYDNLKTYETGTRDGKANIAANLSKLPLGIRSEDFLVYIMDSVSAVNGTLSTVNYRDISQVATFNTVVNGKQVPVTGYQMGASFTGTMNYSQLKSYLDYVYNESDKITFIDSFTMTSDSSSRRLNVNFNLSKYFIEYEGGEYVPVPVPEVSIGINDPFHTS